MKGFMRTWAQRLIAHGISSLKRAKTIGYAYRKRVSWRQKASSHAKTPTDHEDEFSQSLRAELRRVVSSIEPSDAIAEIRKRIREAPNDDISDNGKDDG